MTKREAERWANVVRVLTGEGYGISRDDIEALRRIEMTLHRWSERECNGEVVTYDDGRAWCVQVRTHTWSSTITPIPNREAGALRRLSAIMARYPHLLAYHQTDPRGCALYVYEKARLSKLWNRSGCREEVCTCHDQTSKPYECSSCGCRPQSDADCCYSSVGVAICR